MPPRSIGSGTISFGLVSIPIRLFVATHSEQPSFNLIHQTCGSRIRQQVFCPRCERTVERSELVKGYAVAKDQYVTFGADELKALETAASSAIEIQEFVPLADVDPVFFASSHYLGPDKGGEKAYRLLAQSMRETGRVALAQHVTRGKEHLVLIRPFADGLTLHTLYYADEIRPFDEIDRGGEVTVRDGERELATRLISELSAERFDPSGYRDHYRDRLDEAVTRKVEGQETVAATAATEAPRVIDLMEALKQSLAAERGGTRRAAATKSPRRPARGAKKPRAHR
jgi:DNA end-binding protein Ku